MTIYGFGISRPNLCLTDGLNFGGPQRSRQVDLTQFIGHSLWLSTRSIELRYEPLDGSRFGGEIQFVQADVTSPSLGWRGPTVARSRYITTQIDATGQQPGGLLAPVDQQLFTSVTPSTTPAQPGSLRPQAGTIDRLRHVGAVGSDFWLTQAHQLDQQADSRYKPQGRNPILNQQLQAHRELTDKLAKADAAYGTYWQLLQEQQNLRQQQSQTQDQLAQQRQVTASDPAGGQLVAFAEWQRLGHGRPARPQWL